LTTCGNQMASMFGLSSRARAGAAPKHREAVTSKAFISTPEPDEPRAFTIKDARDVQMVAAPLARNSCTDGALVTKVHGAYLR
jgi:hypothetical protein